MSSTKSLCSCGCERQVTGATERNHLRGQGPSNVVSAAVLDNIYLWGLDTGTLSPSASFPRRKRRRLEPPLQTSGQPFTRGADSDRVDGNLSPMDTGITVPPQGVRHDGPAWPDIEDEEDGSESGEVPGVRFTGDFEESVEDEWEMIADTLESLALESGDGGLSASELLTEEFLREAMTLSESVVSRWWKSADQAKKQVRTISLKKISTYFVPLLSSWIQTCLRQHSSGCGRLFRNSMTYRRGTVCNAECRFYQGSHLSSTTVVCRRASATQDVTRT